MTQPFYVTASEAVDITHLIQQGNGFVIGVFTAVFTEMECAKKPP